MSDEYREGGEEDAEDSDSELGNDADIDLSELLGELLDGDVGDRDESEDDSGDERDSERAGGQAGGQEGGDESDEDEPVDGEGPADREPSSDSLKRYVERRKATFETRIGAVAPDSQRGELFFDIVLEKYKYFLENWSQFKDEIDYDSYGDATKCASSNERATGEWRASLALEKIVAGSQEERDRLFEARLKHMSRDEKKDLLNEYNRTVGFPDKTLSQPKEFGEAFFKGARLSVFANLYQNLHPIKFRIDRMLRYYLNQSDKDFEDALEKLLNEEASKPTGQRKQAGDSSSPSAQFICGLRASGAPEYPIGSVGTYRILDCSKIRVQFIPVRRPSHVEERYFEPELIPGATINGAPGNSMLAAYIKNIEVPPDSTVSFRIDKNRTSIDAFLPDFVYSGGEWAVAEPRAKDLFENARSSMGMRDWTARGEASRKGPMAIIEVAGNAVQRVRVDDVSVYEHSIPFQPLENTVGRQPVSFVVYVTCAGKERSRPPIDYGFDEPSPSDPIADHFATRLGKPKLRASERWLLGKKPTGGDKDEELGKRFAELDKNHEHFSRYLGFLKLAMDDGEPLFGISTKVSLYIAMSLLCKQQEIEKTRVWKQAAEGTVLPIGGAEPMDFGSSYSALQTLLDNFVVEQVGGGVADVQDWIASNYAKDASESSSLLPANHRHIDAALIAGNLPLFLSMCGQRDVSVVSRGAPLLWAPCTSNLIKKHYTVELSELLKVHNTCFQLARCDTFQIPKDPFTRRLELIRDTGRGVSGLSAFNWAGDDVGVLRNVLANTSRSGQLKDSGGNFIDNFSKIINNPNPDEPIAGTFAISSKMKKEKYNAFAWEWLAELCTSMELSSVPTSDGRYSANMTYPEAKNKSTKDKEEDVTNKFTLDTSGFVDDSVGDRLFAFGARLKPDKLRAIADAVDWTGDLYLSDDCKNRFDRLSAYLEAVEFARYVELFDSEKFLPNAQRREALMKSRGLASQRLKVDMVSLLAPDEYKLLYGEDRVGAPMDTDEPTRSAPLFVTNAKLYEQEDKKRKEAGFGATRDGTARKWIENTAAGFRMSGEQLREPLMMAQKLPEINFLRFFERHVATSKPDYNFDDYRLHFDSFKARFHLLVSVGVMDADGASLTNFNSISSMLALLDDVVACVKREDLMLKTLQKRIDISLNAPNYGIRSHLCEELQPYDKAVLKHWAFFDPNVTWIGHEATGSIPPAEKPEALEYAKGAIDGLQQDVAKRLNKLLAMRAELLYLQGVGLALYEGCGGRITADEANEMEAALKDTNRLSLSAYKRVSAKRLAKRPEMKLLDATRVNPRRFANKDFTIFTSGGYMNSDPETRMGPQNADNKQLTRPDFTRLGLPYTTATPTYGFVRLYFEGLKELLSTEGKEEFEFPPLEQYCEQHWDKLMRASPDREWPAAVVALPGIEELIRHVKGEAPTVNRYLPDRGTELWSAVKERTGSQPPQAASQYVAAKPVAFEEVVEPNPYRHRVRIAGILLGSANLKFKVSFLSSWLRRPLIIRNSFAGQQDSFENDETERMLTRLEAIRC